MQHHTHCPESLGCSTDWVLARLVSFHYAFQSFYGHRLFLGEWLDCCGDIAYYGSTDEAGERE